MDTAAWDGPGADQHVVARELAELVDDVLSGLPESSATAFRLLKVEGLSVNEAAKRLGTTSLAVRLRAHRAYEALREALGEDWPMPKARHAD